MKPRNKFEARVAALSATLSPISDAQETWAKKNLFPREGYRHGKRVWCLHCGRVFLASHEDSSAMLNNEKCPHCGARIKVSDCRNRTYRTKWYYNIVTTCQDLQVVRSFICTKAVTGKDTPPQYSFREVVQNWIDKDGRHAVMALPRRLSWYYMDIWNYEETLSIKAVGKDVYCIDATTYPHMRLLPELVRNGYTGETFGLAHVPLFQALLADREAETLLKCGQIALLRHKLCRGIAKLRYPHAVRIATRHGYIVEDASLWMDYIRLLDHFGLDTHNAHYVCPADLHAAHDRLLARKRRQEAKERASKELAKALQEEERYQQSKGKYFGICFGGDGITISVLCSVKEILEEGVAMHHCVYDCGYYKKNSLILSARDSEGNRIETVEVSLATYKVVQSRGVCNKLTDKHKQIVSLVEQNMHRIASVA